jgi:hypothetical protein
MVASRIGCYVSVILHAGEAGVQCNSSPLDLLLSESFEIPVDRAISWQEKHNHRDR